ncbi:MAG: hypothetical protein Ct9H300mP28_35350 [Pseudomonadota bacterium]|nr:MAG: hypothetical protein Ct9H300mP28_35350 [Pseudomonadota bacterium]
MNLNEIIDEIREAHAEERMWPECILVIRPFMAQYPNKCGCLKVGFPYDVTPGVPSFAAAAAELKQELTLPEVSQTIIALVPPCSL